jgi:hypothetical protein
LRGKQQGPNGALVEEVDEKADDNAARGRHQRRETYGKTRAVPTQHREQDET